MKPLSGSYRATKTYCHNIGLTCAFRQWTAKTAWPREKSYCHFVHGYALEISFVFEASELDDRNWVVDFGALRGLKKELKRVFDHKVVVAHDDPHLDYFLQGKDLGVMDVIVLKDSTVGCEGFAKLAYDLATQELEKLGVNKRVTVVSAEVREHGANSAIYFG